MSDVDSEKASIWAWIIVFALVIGVNVMNNVLGVWSWIITGVLALFIVINMIINKCKTGRWKFWDDRDDE